MALQEDTRPVLVGNTIDLTESAVPSTQMQVRKRDGSLEAVDLNKIVRAIGRCATNLDGTQLDGKRLTQDHPDIAARYTVTRPGARRFVIVDAAA